MSEVPEEHGLIWSGWDAFALDFARDAGVNEDSDAPVKKVFQDSVDVVYAESPSNFYVRFQRHRDKLYFIYYTVHVREWRDLKSPDICLQTEENCADDDSDWTDDDEDDSPRLKIGQWVLARQTHLGPKRPPFQRAQIKQFYYDDDGGVMDSVLVELLDWGIVTLVEPGEIRFLPRSLLTVPRLAKQCTLNRIYPLPAADDDEGTSSGPPPEDEEDSSEDDDDEWSEEAKDAFVSLIQDGELQLEMIHDTICAGAGPAEVDLLLYKDGNPSSVRDMLLFEDFGCLADPKTFGEEEYSDQDTSYDYDVLGAEGPLPPPPNDIQTLSLEAGSWLLVKMTCVRSPAEVHVQPIKMAGGGGCLWADMQSRMDAFYANRDIQYRYQIQDPVEGMVCAVRISGDTTTYRRGRIEQVVPQTRLAQVMMPDTGHRLVVGTRDLFILSTDDFVKPCQYALSLPVSMNNIKPIFPLLGWGGEATRHMRAFLGHTLAMHVCPDEVVAPPPPPLLSSVDDDQLHDDDPPTSGLPSVALFWANNDRFICLNSQLVEMNICASSSKVANRRSVAEGDSSFDEQEDSCPILNMLARCASNDCRHPLDFDDAVLEWMMQEWIDD